MGPYEVRQLITDHGGIEAVEVRDEFMPEYVATANGTRVATGRQVRNPQPSYRWRFKSGKYLDLTPRPDGSYARLGGTAEPKKPAPTGPVYDPRTRETRVNPMSGDIQEYPGRSMGFYDEAGTLWKDPAASTSGPTVREIGGALYQWDPTSSSWQLAIAKPPSAGADNSVGWANLAQRQREFEAEAARQAAKDALDIERWNAAQTRQAEQDEWDKSRWGKEYALDRDKFAGTLSDQWTGRQIQAMPYAVDPSWTSYPGFEAGGPVERLYRMGGSTSYTPPVIPRTTFDPIAAWRAAQAETRR